MAVRWATAGVTAVALAATLGWAAYAPDRDGGPDDSAGSDGGTAAAADQLPEPPSAPPGETAPGQARHATPAPSQVVPVRPSAIVLPSGQRVPVDASATGPDGELAIPTDIDRAGWWDGGSRLGDPFGSMVVAAHVDSFSQGLGRFAELLDMRPGDVVRVEARGGLSQDYRVTSARLTPKAEVDAGSPLYSPRGGPRLVLITCGGAYDPATGYQDNMVVVAVPDGPLRGA